jgi:hypothetical protein
LDWETLNAQEQRLRDLQKMFAEIETELGIPPPP